MSTKEEVFLLLAGDECDGYFEALLAALPEGCGLAPDVVAEVWAGIANAHQEYFRLGDLLTTIIETNVTVERLACFKRGYYTHVGAMEERLPRILDIRAESVEPLLMAIYYHARRPRQRIAGATPLVAQALETIGRERRQIDFRARDARLHRDVPRALRGGSRGTPGPTPLPRFSPPLSD